MPLAPHKKQDFCQACQGDTSTVPHLLVSRDRAQFALSYQSPCGGFLPYPG